MQCHVAHHEVWKTKLFKWLHCTHRCNNILNVRVLLRRRFALCVKSLFLQARIARRKVGAEIKQDWLEVRRCVRVFLAAVVFQSLYDVRLADVHVIAPRHAAVRPEVPRSRKTFVTLSAAIETVTIWNSKFMEHVVDVRQFCNISCHRSSQ